MTIADLIMVTDINPHSNVDFIDIKTNKNYDFSMLAFPRLERYEVVKITPTVFHGSPCLQVKFFKKNVKRLDKPKTK